MTTMGSLPPPCLESRRSVRPFLGVEVALDGDGGLGFEDAEGILRLLVLAPGFDVDERGSTLRLLSYLVVADDGKAEGGLGVVLELAGFGILTDETRYFEAVLDLLHSFDVFRS